MGVRSTGYTPTIPVPCSNFIAQSTAADLSAFLLGVQFGEFIGFGLLRYRNFPFFQAGLIALYAQRRFVHV